MLARIKATIIVLLALAWPELGAAQSCVQSGIAAGGDHTCAFTVGGTAMCWGDNQFGQAGNGTFATPVPMPTVAVGVAPTAIVAGQRHTCALDGRGLVPVCWGDHRAKQLGADQIPGPAAGTCPLGDDACSAYPVPVHGPDGVAAFSGVSALAAGDQNSCMLWGNHIRNVLCWGDNGSAQLGIGRIGGQLSNPGPPNEVAFVPSDAPAIAISAGGLHTCALMQGDDTVRCWGDNTFGQIGNNTSSNTPANTPQTVFAFDGLPLDDVRMIAAGGRHACALRTNSGDVYCWGDNSSGQIGSDPTTTAKSPVATMVLDPSGLTLIGMEIAAGAFHSCVIKTASGNVQCWGSNSHGQLGPAVAVGANSASPVTVPITDANGIALPVAHIAAGANHTCAALAAGGVQCWGDNSFGQLGASTAPNTMSATPVAVAGVCTCSGLTACNGQCVDTTSDAQNCGGCFNACSGGTCVASACICPAGDGTLCPASGSSHVCADTTSDPHNCGACGTICSEGETCVNRVCICGLTICGGRCVDTQTDNNNCGRCNRHCRINPPCSREESGCTACENGECVPF